MFSFFTSNQWQESPSNLLLLSKFMGGDNPERYFSSEPWEVALNKSPKKVIKTLLNNGALAEADLSTTINCQFKASELKSLLKTKGLSTSGKKQVLIERLLEKHADEMREQVKGVLVLQCSALGMELAERFLASEKNRKSEAENKTMNFLQNRSLDKAIKVVVEYEKLLVFPRGLNFNWDSQTIKSTESELSVIFNKLPVLLAMVQEDALNHIRLIAGMMCLWGSQSGISWKADSSIDTGIHLDSTVASRMLLFYAGHIRNLKQLELCGCKSVEIISSNNCCSECKKLDGKKFSIKKAPELPYHKCSCELGCRCAIVG